MSFQDLTGMTFGRLTVIERAENYKRKQAQWRCRCECGNEIITTTAHLKSGHTSSCGCLNRERASQRLKKHGLRQTKTYVAWAGAKDRCYNPNCEHYDCYGGRGIKMFEFWINNFQSFYDYVSLLENFDKAGYSLDRIDVNGDYVPGNLRWVNQRTQCRNKRTNVLVEYQGVQMTLAEASEKSEIYYESLRYRYKRGKRGDELFKPVKK